MTQAREAAKTVTILGCGYVGLTTAAILAEAGYKVYAVEPNPERLRIIQSGRSFFFEVGLDALVAAGISSGQLVATDSYDSVEHSSVVFSCVGTPDKPDGSSNLQYVYDAAKQSAARMPAGAIYVQKSTVPVGTGEQLIEQHFTKDRSIAYVSNPEFLSESTAVADTLWPARVVTGSRDEAAARQILDVYRDIEKAASAVATRASIDKPQRALTTEYISTSLDSAELIKVSSNAFLALKISFANSMAKLADATGADITEVMHAVGTDPRIGTAFLNAGRGYGGGCFPKDVSGLIRSAAEYGVSLPIMKAASDTNDSMADYCVQKIMTALQTADDSTNNHAGSRVAMLGLAFKAGTSDTRRSPAIAIVRLLVANGVQVAAFDPVAMREAEPELPDAVIRVSSLEDAIRDVDCICLATDWPEFLDNLPTLLADMPPASRPHAIIDCMNKLSPDTLPQDMRYDGIGKRR